LTDLQQIAEEVRSCTKCALHQGRTNAVPGEGAGNSSVMFIGEGPGFYEDREGRPFVGPAGKFLEQLLKSINMKRTDVYIANMVKCRPINNRDPLPIEIQECAPYLDRQIEIVNPKIIVTLGRHALSKFFPNESIMRARGKPRKISGDRIVYPILHPAAALHRQDLRATIETDFLTIPELLQSTPSETVPTDESPKQLNLF